MLAAAPTLFALLATDFVPVVEAQQNSVTTPQPPRVSIDLSSVDQRLYEVLDLGSAYKSLLVRIMQEGMAVVTPDNEADIRLRLLDVGDGLLRITVAVGAWEDTTEVLLADDEPHNLSLRVFHHTEALIRAARAQLATSRQSSPPVQAQAERALPTRWSGQAAAATWLSLNPGQQGFVIDMTGGIGWTPGFQLVAGGAIYQPLGLDPRLRVTEWGLRLGIASHWILVERWLNWDTSATFGFWQHHAVFKGEVGAAATQRRWDPAIFILTSLGVEVVSHLHVALGGGALITRRERIHRLADETLWRATPWRGLVGVTVRYTFDISPWEN